MLPVGRCVFLDLCAGPHAMTEDHGLFVHLNADGDVLVSRDFEAVVELAVDVNGDGGLHDASSHEAA